MALTICSVGITGADNERSFYVADATVDLPLSGPRDGSLGIVLTGGITFYGFTTAAGGSWKKVGPPVWGDVTGTLSAQTDLQTALDLPQAVLAPTRDTTVTAGHSALVLGEYRITSGTELIVETNAELGVL